MLGTEKKFAFGMTVMMTVSNTLGFAQQNDPVALGYALQGNPEVRTKQTAFPIEAKWRLLFPLGNKAYFYKYLKPVHINTDLVYVRIYDYSQSRLSQDKLEYSREEAVCRSIGGNEYNLTTGKKIKSNSDLVTPWDQIEPNTVLYCLHEQINAARNNYILDPDGFLSASPDPTKTPESHKHTDIQAQTIRQTKSSVAYSNSSIEISNFTIVHESRLSCSAIAKITNKTQKKLSMVQVGIQDLDSNGTILGSHGDFVTQLPAGGSARLSFNCDKDAVRVRVFSVKYK